MNNSEDRELHLLIEVNSTPLGIKPIRIIPRDHHVEPATLIHAVNFKDHSKEELLRQYSRVYLIALTENLLNLGPLPRPDSIRYITSY